MPNTLQESMEDVSFAYMQGLCAYNGYTISKAERDNDGVDATIKCKGYPIETSCKLCSPSIDIQLKASYAKIKQKRNGDLIFVLETKNYNNLIMDDRMIPIILVVLHMDKERKKWVKHSKSALKITKCAYWVNLKNHQPTNNGSSISVIIPKENILSCECLKKLMIKVSKEEEL
ncbi:DUF4365 domain-containing protein [Bacteroides graminisolvens]